ncbi:protein hunchback-like [Temnothorax curvispinosus]|uniref:Protein hunchback n=1 Tax=Temnothorax curvispinosus TaxID=300111 RepID=A0A6J1QAH3_9HYME|nr:protein hunchback-like [Temnothorax curvispinosus]
MRPPIIIMDKYQADRSLSTVSNIIPLSISESINPMRDRLQCPLCVFATSSRPEFTEHLRSRCTPKQRNTSNLKAVLAHLPALKSPFDPHGDSCFSFTLTEHETVDEHQTDEQSSLGAYRVTPRENNVNGRRDRSLLFREAKTCKHCTFIASTKMEYWEHMRCHIKGFTCSECSFVTKYKHHMNHHWLSAHHDGSKPFKCKKCLYTCVSKSMLTSHLKKHSNIYPYRCADCTYKSKFCNALKKHLRNKKHQPAMVLNADGSPNPLFRIDVYGTKRGPKHNKLFASAKEQQEDVKSTVATMTTTANDDQQLGSASVTCPALLSLYSPIARRPRTVTAINGINDVYSRNQSGINKNTSVATFPYYRDLVAAFNLSSHVSFCKDATFYENVRRTDHAQSGTLTEYAKILNVRNKMPDMFAQRLPVTIFDTTNNIMSEHHSSDSVKAPSDASTTFVAVKTTQLDYQTTRDSTSNVPLDLRMADEVRGKTQFRFQGLAQRGATSPKVTRGTSKRKGKAIKLERRVVKENTDQEPRRNGGVSFESSPDSTAGFRKVNQRIKDTKDETVADLFDAELLICHYCEIIFGNVIMYAMHMGCHTFDDPYTCNICGQQCIDKLSFFLHIARSEH